MTYDHQRSRALERYGVTLTEADIEDGVRQISTGEATLQSKERHGGGSTWFIKLHGKIMRCVYLPRGYIVTFLPMKDDPPERKRFKSGRPKDRYKILAD